MPAKKENTSEIGFEKELWKAADKLRGSMDASQYKYIILGLIFLKYLSDIFEQKYRELVAEGDGLENDLDAYLADNIFFVPEDARWELIAAKAHTPEIGITINNAMKSIEDRNPKLKNVLPNDFADPDLDQQRLGDVVDLFTNIKIPKNANEKDILGRCYEYCLGQFASKEGKNAGEFYTPSCIVRTIVEILQPYEGRIYDPCCGAGGMFVQSAKFVKSHGGKLGNISVFGQESNPTTWKLAQMNLAIRGIEADLGAYAADTFTNDLHAHEKMDFIMANPPFNNKEWWHESLREDYRWKYGTPPEGNANFAWMEHMIAHLSPNGKIGMVLAKGSLSTSQNGEDEIRRKIIEDDLVECIISLPSQLFYNTQSPASLWFLNRNKKQKYKTLFIDAMNMGKHVTKKLIELQPEEINIITDIYQNYLSGKQCFIKGFSAVASIEDIEKNNFIITPGRYVGISDKNRPSEEILQKNLNSIRSKFNSLLINSNDLQKNLKNFLENDLLYKDIDYQNLNNNNNEVYLCELIDKIISGSWGQDEKSGSYVEEVKCIRGTDINDANRGILDNAPTRYISSKHFKERKLLPNDIVIEISGGSPTQSTGRVALIKSCTLEAYQNKVICSNFCKIIRPKPNYSLLLFSYLKYLYNIGLMFAYENGTTGIKNFDLGSFIHRIKIKMFSDEQIQELNKILNPIILYIDNCSLQEMLISNLQELTINKIFNKFY